MTYNIFLVLYVIPSIWPIFWSTTHNTCTWKFQKKRAISWLRCHWQTSCQYLAWHCFLASALCNTLTNEATPAYYATCRSELRTLIEERTVRHLRSVVRLRAISNCVCRPAGVWRRVQNVTERMQTALQDLWNIRIEGDNKNCNCGIISKNGKSLTRNIKISVCWIFCGKAANL
jgi:hypothetical protein